MRLDNWIQDRASTDRVAFWFADQAITYATFAERIDATAAGLVELGVQRGDRVGFCGLNRVELFEAFFACARLGAIVMPMNNRLTPVELRWQIANSTPSVVLTTDGFDAAMAAVVEGLEEGVEVPTLRDLDRDPFPTGSNASVVGIADTEADDADVLMVYTSGTTGRPKGAVLTRAQSDTPPSTALSASRSTAIQWC